MQARTSTALGLGALALLVAIAAALGRRENQGVDQDLRPSSYLAGPAGVRGLADALGQLGIQVERSRRPLRALAARQFEGQRTAVVLLNPDLDLDGTEIQLLAEWSAREDGPDLVLAGAQVSPLMHCFGYGVDFGQLSRFAIRAPVAGDSWPELRAVLAARSASIIADSGRLADTAVTGCTVVEASTIDTLLTTRTGRVAALRIHRVDRNGSVTLLSDPVLLENRAVRETAAGPFALGLFIGRYERVIFEERSHGFGEEGSLRLPPGWLDAQGLAAGDPVICRTDPRGLLIMSRAAATEALRELARKHMPGEAALLDALLSGTREQL